MRIERDRKIALDDSRMAKVVVVCWQDIPSLVEVRDGASVAKQQLSARFQELIDIVAMRKKLVNSDAYLEHWNRRKGGERAGDVTAIAAAVAAERRYGFSGTGPLRLSCLRLCSTEPDRFDAGPRTSCRRVFPRRPICNSRRISSACTGAA
jgi:hypothetical protein